MSELWQVYIPSKGRGETIKIHPSLNAKIVVEPQEAEFYKNYDTIILPKDNQGIAYVRNYIKSINKGWYWMLDDDVNWLGYVANKKIAREDPSKVLLLAQRDILRFEDQVAQAGLQYQQFCWCATKPVSFNKSCQVVVAIDAKKAFCDYRPEVQLKEDIDFSMQLISSGFKTMILNGLCFSCPTIGSNKGGLYEIYRTNLEKSCDAMIAKWGHGFVSKIKKPNGMIDIKINWKALSGK